MAVPTMKSIAKKKGYVGIGGGKYKTPGKNTVKWTGKKFKIIAGPMFRGGPFRPLSPSYKTNAQLNAAVDKEARAGIRPELANISADTRYETEGSKTRQKDISGWYGWQQGELNDAFHDANLALSNLIATTRLATRPLSSPCRQLFAGMKGHLTPLLSQLGTMPPQSNDAQRIIAAALQSGDASQRGVLGTAEAGLLGMANPSVVFRVLELTRPTVTRRDAWRGSLTSSSRRRMSSSVVCLGFALRSVIRSSLRRLRRPVRQWSVELGSRSAR
jgi:hypothetical protein